jgi:DHA2 family multidrug resistance protein
MLVACRIGQGICGAPLMPMSQTLMMRVFPPEKRGAAIGVWAMTTILGPASGPIIGGLINDSMSWHWIFLINIPVAAICVVAAWFLLRPAETATRKVPIDRVGLVLLVFWIGCLQIMLDIGRDHDWFGDWKIVGLAIMAALGFLVFVIWELTEEHPVVDLRIFRYRSFSAGVFTLALAFGSYFASIVVIPQWLQSSLGYTATRAGLITASSSIASLTTATLAARLMGKIDQRILISGAVLWLALMTLWRTTWTTGSDFWTLMVPQIAQGFLIPFFIVPLTSVSLGAVRPDEVASASGLQNFLRTMAIAISTSLALTIWGNADRAAQNDLAARLNPGDTLETLNRAGMGLEQSRQIIAGIADKEAMMLAVDHTFFVTAIVLLVAAAVVWISPRPTAQADMSQMH